MEPSIDTLLGPGANQRSFAILQLLWRDVVGGAEQIAHQLADAWATRGMTSDLAYLDPDGTGSDRFVRVVRMRRLLHSTHHDVVLAHTALPSLYARVVAPRRLAVVPVLHSGYDDFNDPQLRWAERILARRSPLTIAVGQRQKDEYEARFGHLSHCFVVNNAVRNDLPISDASRDSGAVVTVSRFLDAKGTRIWEQCARSMLAADPTLSFHWWGPVDEDNPAAGDFHRLVAEQHPRIVLHGSTDDVGSALQNATVFFLPSHIESFNIAVLEALSAGVPVVCSEFVAASYPDWLPIVTFADRDPVAARDALTTVLANWKEHKVRALATAARVRTEFSVERMAAGYAGVLTAAYAKNRHG